MKLSVIIPVYNGAQTIAGLVDELNKELAAKFDLEIVLVNDGSSLDNSAEVCQSISEGNAKVKFLDLSRNFGEHNAVMAGLNFCTGDIAVIMDDDGQNLPSDVINLADKLNEGYDVVFSCYDKREHSFLRNFGSWFNNWAATVLIGKPRSLYLSSFKAVTRFVVDELIKYKGPYPYIDGLILRVTRNYGTVLAKHKPRTKGRSGYTVRKLISLWLNVSTNFSILPLRFAMLFGFAFASVGFVLAAVFIIKKLQNPGLEVGWALIAVSIFVIAGVQLIAIGMIGEYLGRMFMNDSGKQQFVVRKKVNC